MRTLRLARPARLLAVARYEMRSHMTGRPALRLIGVAAALLLPAGLVPTPKLRPPVAVTSPHTVPQALPEAGMDGPPAPPLVEVRGAVPPGLESRMVLADDSPYEVRAETPVVLVAPEVTQEMRAALETVDGPVGLESREIVRKARLPGRSLLIAILAISLLTGPLADALPGERSRRTLEVLLTAGITRGELVGGKWLAWTASSSATALFAAALACWRGVQEPGWWIVGLPLFVGSAVALGLWLVRLVDDVVGGSAAPMRVLPVAAGTMAAVAKGAAGVSPALGAAIPLGGPLLVAANLAPSSSEAAAAAFGTVVFVIGALTLTGRDLDRIDLGTGPTRWGALGLGAVATLLWWLTVGGPGVWSGGGAKTSDLVTALPRSILVGAMALMACGVIAVARRPRRLTEGAAPSSRFAVSRRLAVATAVAAALAAGGAPPSLDLAPARPAVEFILGRLREAAVPTDLLSGAAAVGIAALSLASQAWLFRAVVAREAGWIAAAVMWSVAANPWAPWSVAPGSLALGCLAWWGGWSTAFAAHLAWAAGASAFGSVGLPGASLAAQALALLVVLAASREARGEPRRHHS